MKKIKILTPIALLSAVSLLAGCGNIKDKLHKLADYFYEVDTYTKLDYDYADKFWADNNDNWGGGCSAVTKLLYDEDGNPHRVVGRNMDLNISNKCAYVVRTNVEGGHKTVGLAYTFRDYSPDYVDVEKKGISEHFYKILPFMCDDVLNDTGLHIEVNMRHGEHYPNGDDMFSMEHSDPKNFKGKRRIHMFELPRYIGENCTTVAEAKEYVKTLDIYSKYGYWNYCFLISDATGAASLVEFNEIGLSEAFNISSAKRVSWFDDTPEDLAKIDEYLTWGPAGAAEDIPINGLAQTNFYVNKYAWTLEDTKSGEGRYITLQENIDDVETKLDMFNLMDKISYHWFYEAYDLCMNEHFDPRTENVGEGPGLTYGILFDPDPVIQEYIKFYFNYYALSVYQQFPTREAKRDANKFWETTFCEVVDCMTKTIQVRIFEENSIYCNVGLDSTTMLDSEAAFRASLVW